MTGFEYTPLDGSCNQNQHVRAFWNGKQDQLFTDHYIGNIQTNGYVWVIREHSYDYIW